MLALPELFSIAARNLEDFVPRTDPTKGRCASWIDRIDSWPRAHADNVEATPVRLVRGIEPLGLFQIHGLIWEVEGDDKTGQIVKPQ